MSNLVEFVISMKDLASKTLGSVAGTAMELGQNIKKATGETEFLSKSVNELKDRLNDVNKVRTGTVLSKEFKEATAEAKKLEKEIENLNRGLLFSGGFAGKLAEWRSDLAASIPGAHLLRNPLVFASGVAGGIIKSVQKAADADLERSKLQAVTNDVVGDALFTELTKFSIETGVEGVNGMAEALLRANMEASEVIPTLQMLGDISAGDAGMMNQLTTAMLRAAADGNLTTRVLRRMQRAGFYPLQVVMAQTGESLEEVEKRMEEGRISYDELTEAMQKSTEAGGAFHNAMAIAGDTPTAKFQQLKDTMSQMMIEVGETFLPIFEKIVGGAQWVADKMGPFLKPAIVFVGILSAGLLAAAAAQWVFNIAMAMNPVGLIIAGVIALIATIAYLIYNIEGWGNAWTHTVNAAKYLWQGFVAEAKWYWDTMVNGLMIGLNKIQEGWYKFKNAVGLGSSDENNAMLSKIQADTDKRKSEIESGQREYLELYQKS